MQYQNWMNFMWKTQLFEPLLDWSKTDWKSHEKHNFFLLLSFNLGCTFFWKSRQRKILLSEVEKQKDFFHICWLYYVFSKPFHIFSETEKIAARRRNLLTAKQGRKLYKGRNLIKNKEPFKSKARKKTDIFTVSVINPDKKYAHYQSDPLHFLVDGVNIFRSTLIELLLSSTEKMYTQVNLQTLTNWIQPSSSLFCSL